MAIQWGAPTSTPASTSNIQWGNTAAPTSNGTVTPTPAAPTKDSFNPLPITSHPANAADAIWQALVNYGSGVKQAATGGVNQVIQASNDSAVGGMNPIYTGAKAAGGIASVVSAPLAPIFSPIGKIINDVTQPIQNNPTVQKFANSPAGIATAQTAETVSNLANTAGTVAGVQGAVESAPSYLSKAQSLYNTVKDKLTAPSEPIESVQQPLDTQPIVENYTKAIKPTVVGKKTPQLQDKYNSNVVNAVQSIVSNKDELSFNTPSGDVVTGRTPQNLSEFNQAIDQTKAKIFGQYDALAKQATGQGATVSTESAVNALQKVADNEALQITNPSAVSFAKDLISRFGTEDAEGNFVPKDISPDTAQEIIKNYNSTLETFYRNPSYDNASKAAIEAGVLYQMREALDSTITKATGEQYGTLKAQYAALKAIEADVAKRAVVQARQISATGSSGIGDYAAIFAGGDIVHGLLTLNPAMLGKGTLELGLNKFFSYLKSPDRAISTMFKAADSAPSPQAIPLAKPQE